MNATIVALVVAAIAAVSGITVGIVNARSARVIARQDAIKVELALLVKLHEDIANMGRACNAYALEIVAFSFYDRGNWDLRGPLLVDLTSAHGDVLTGAHALESDSLTRRYILEAADIAISLGVHPSDGHEWRQIKSSWNDRNEKIRVAVECVGALRRSLYVDLEEVTRNPVSRRIRARKRRGKQVKRAWSDTAHTGCSSIGIPGPFLRHR